MLKWQFFIINLCCCAPFCNYSRDFTVFPCFHRHLCRFERPVANALEQFKQLKPTHEMFDSCRNCGALQGVHENASLVLTQHGPLKAPFKRKLAALIPQTQCVGGAERG